MAYFLPHYLADPSHSWPMTKLSLEAFTASVVTVASPLSLTILPACGSYQFNRRKFPPVMRMVAATASSWIGGRTTFGGVQPPVTKPRTSAAPKGCLDGVLLRPTQGLQQQLMLLPTPILR